MNLIEEKVLQTIKKYSMINAGDKVLLALSGGYDSTALCLVLNNLVDILKIKLAVAHLNHSIRGKEADEDEKFVIALANQLNIPVITKKIDIPALKAQSKKFSLEELARTERYKFLKETAQKLKVSKIATGHTANDQIENFFLSALLGRGTTALAGIPPVTQNIIRPLIECTKDEILQYLKEQGIEARLDSSNLDVKIPRNWIRHKLIPFIQHNFKPFKTSILQTINILHCEDLFLEKIVDALFEDVKYNNNGIYRVVLPFIMKNLEISVVRRLVKRIFKYFEIKYTFDEIDFLSQRLKAGINVFQLNNLIVWCYKNYTIFTPKNEIKAYKFQITPSQSIKIPVLNLSVKCELCEQLKKFEQNSIYLNIPEKSTIIIRSRKTGDKIQLMNTKYFTSLKKLFIDLKIPQPIKDVIPIIEIDNQIAALYLNIFPLNLKNRVSETHKILDKRKKFVKLYFERV